METSLRFVRIQQVRIQTIARYESECIGLCSPSNPIRGFGYLPGQVLCRVLDFASFVRLGQQIGLILARFQMAISTASWRRDRVSRYAERLSRAGTADAVLLLSSTFYHDTVRTCIYTCSSCLRAPLMDVHVRCKVYSHANYAGSCPVYRVRV